jgi:hypothetical protein
MNTVLYYLQESSLIETGRSEALSGEMVGYPALLTYLSAFFIGVGWQSIAVAE